MTYKWEQIYLRSSLLWFLLYMTVIEYAAGIDGDCVPDAFVLTREALIHEITRDLPIARNK